MSTHYRDKMEKVLDILAAVLSSTQHRVLIETYRGLYQEIRNEVCDDLKRMDASARAIERRYGAMEEKRRIAGVLGLAEAFDE